jgi:hypothetical protein
MKQWFIEELFCKYLYIHDHPCCLSISKRVIHLSRGTFSHVVLTIMSGMDENSVVSYHNVDQ